MIQGRRLPFWAVVERTLSAAMHFLPLFLIPILIVFALVKLASWGSAQLHPPLDPDAPGMTTEMVLRSTITSLLWARAYLLPVRILELLLAGFMARHIYVWWQKETLSLRADAGVVGRNAVALAVIALMWVVLNVLPVLPSLLLAPLPPPDWLSGRWGALLYIYVFMNPSYPAVLCVLLALGILFCLAVPAVVMEGLGPVAALRRSVQLTKGHRLRIFGLWALYAAITLGVTVALSTGAARLHDLIPLPGPLSWTDISQAINSLLDTILAVTGSTAIYAELSHQPSACHSASAHTTPSTA